MMPNQHRRDCSYIQIDICDSSHIHIDPVLWHHENEGAWHFIRYAQCRRDPSFPSDIELHHGALYIAWMQAIWCLNAKSGFMHAFCARPQAHVGTWHGWNDSNKLQPGAEKNSARKARNATPACVTTLFSPPLDWRAALFFEDHSLSSHEKWPACPLNQGASNLWA
jgi:hypothetical protein